MELFWDRQCPRCGQICGNESEGYTVRCRCGWSGEISKYDRDLLEQVYLKHLERNREGISHEA